jgi:hypothetical protein
VIIEFAAVQGRQDGGACSLSLARGACPAYPYRGKHFPRSAKLICPLCEEGCRRSRRKSVLDCALGVAGLRPWRCEECDHRFYAWSVPVRFLIYAHCRRCGNFDVQRISRELGEATFPLIWRLSHTPAYRAALPAVIAFFRSYRAKGTAQSNRLRLRDSFASVQSPAARDPIRSTEGLDAAISMLDIEALTSGLLGHQNY